VVLVTVVKMLIYQEVYSWLHSQLAMLNKFSEVYRYLCVGKGRKEKKKREVLVKRVK
jgi:hypothetical protein